MLSIQEVIAQSGVNLRDPECALLLSTTKGNVELLSELVRSDESENITQIPADSPAFLWKMAERIGEFLKQTIR